MNEQARRVSFWLTADDEAVIARSSMRPFGLDLLVARAARPLYGPALGLALYESDTEHRGAQ